MSLIDLEYAKIIEPDLECFDFKVNSGDIIKIDGDSGIGKSSFLRALVGLKKMDYKNWKINSKDRSELEVKEIRNDILYLPQFAGQDETSVNRFIENVLKEKASKCYSYLEEFELSYLSHRKLEELSGGEAQLLGIALSLVLDRKVLLLDESFSAIDQSRCELASRKIIDTCLDKKAIVYISHQPLLFDKKITKRYLIESTQNGVYLRKVNINN